MSSDADQPIGYAAAIDAYWNAGWKPLPLRAGSKWPPPKGYSGYGGIEPSYPDLMAWAEDYRDGNLCLRLPDGVIGIDVDAYGAKTGAATFVEAINRWGGLPLVVKSSSRAGDRLSGIRLFRVAPGTALETVIAFPELGVGDVEIIQHHHRYVVAWPSIHPEGGTYHWRDDLEELRPIPRVDELPWLPAAWVEGLKVVPKTDFSDSELRYDISLALTAGQPSLRVQNRLTHALAEISTVGVTRHDACCRHVMALARFGKSGDAGVKYAMQALCERLVELRLADGSNTAEGTKHEFIQMLKGDRLSQELARTGIDDWIQDLLSVEPTPEDDSGPVDRGATGPEAVTNNADAGSGSSVIVDDSAPASPLEAIEQGFWQSRESLSMVWQSAVSVMASPWGTLGVTAAKALNTVRPNATLPPVITGPGSLNMFIALVARSGGGKGAANGASRLLIPDHLVTDKGLGSGEGLVALFGRSADEDDPTPINESLLINVDEVDTLTALGQRSGSTMMSVLRSAFMGETLGFSYADKSKRRDLRAHTYRMTMVVGVQPKNSGPLLADSGGGTPQRFMWFPAKDSRVPLEECWPSGPLQLPHPSEWLYKREIQIPDEVRYAIRYNRWLDQRDEVDAEDGHAMFCREKFAFALAVMDGRVAMTMEDWELSGVAAEVSKYTRELCRVQLYEAARLDAAERGAIRGIEMESADVEKLQEQVKRGQRVMKWLLHKLDEAPLGYLTQTELVQKISGRDRKTLTDILGSNNQLIRSELIEGVVRWHRN